MRLSNSFATLGATMATLAALATINSPSAVAQTVTVTNPTSQPVPVKPVDVPGTKPYQKTLEVKISNGDDRANSDNSIFVPVGRMLVVEHVSLRGSCQGGTTDVAYVLNIHNPTVLLSGGEAGYYLVAGKASFPPIGNQQTYNPTYGSSPVRYYAPPGTTIGAIAERPGFTGACDLFVGISGYIQDVPLDVRF